MALFSKNQSSSGVRKLDEVIKEAFGDSFGFDGDSFWVGVLGTSVISISHVTHEPNFATIHINAHVVRDLMISPALCFDLMTNPEYQFNARWRLQEEEEQPGHYMLMLGADLFDVNESLNAEEFAIRIEMLASIAGSIDDDLVQNYGGLTAIEALETD